MSLCKVFLSTVIYFYQKALLWCAAWQWPHAQSTLAANSERCSRFQTPGYS